MRIAIGNWTMRQTGGVEIYLDLVVPELARRGHELIYVCETKSPADRPAMGVERFGRVLCVEELGAKEVLRQLRAWSPDLLYSHGYVSPELESAIQAIPGKQVFFVHSYYGTCISGTKCHSRPRPMPCSRRLGWKCLGLYHARGCGGNSPFTMWRNFQLQTRRQRLLANYHMVLTHSQHMQVELAKHGVTSVRIPFVNDCVSESRPSPERATHLTSVRLAFLGRMDFLKGGGHLIDALPIVQRRLGGPLHLTMAGSGPMRAAWEMAASRATAANSKLTVDFPGWLTTTSRRELLRRVSVVVVPSLWPEPFGLVGLEAGGHGVPVAAFDVGGVRDWLSEGVNGHLADGAPASAAGLANAIVACLQDDRHHAALSEGARRLSQRHHTEAHVDALIAHATAADFGLTSSLKP